MAGAADKPIVTAAAQRYGIDPNLLWGVYGTETNYGQDNSTSSAGAQGPFQFIPSTAAQYHVDVNSLQSSAQGAAHLLSDLLHQNGGNVNAALNAYNGNGGGTSETSYTSSVKSHAQGGVSGMSGAAGAATGSTADASLLGSLNPLNILSTVFSPGSKIIAEIGKLFIGAILILMGVYRLVKDTTPVRTAKNLGAQAATNAIS